MTPVAMGVLLFCYGTLCIVTYRNPDANPVTRFVESMYRIVRIRTPIPYRILYLIAGMGCVIGGLALILADLFDYLP